LENLLLKQAKVSVQVSEEGIEQRTNTEEGSDAELRGGQGQLKNGQAGIRVKLEEATLNCGAQSSGIQMKLTQVPIDNSDVATQD
jgi:hypothetical protein